MSSIDDNIIETLERIKCEYEFLVTSECEIKESTTYDFGRLYLLEKVEDELRDTIELLSKVKIV